MFKLSPIRYIYRFRLYFLAVGLFCLVLLLLEASNILPKRSKEVSDTSLKSAAPTSLNMSHRIEYLGTVTEVQETVEASMITIILGQHESQLLAIGDILYIPDVGIAVVTSVEKQASVTSHTTVSLQTNSSKLQVGESISLYR